jgi:ubiquinone/menaquinone biosynthesis C-methylase UbiE
MSSKQAVQETFSLARPKTRRWVDLYDKPNDLFEVTMRMRRDYVVSYILTHCAGTDDILDLGCGAGPLSAELAARGLHVVGMDLSADLLSEASRRIAGRAHRVPLLLRGDCEVLPFRDDYFGVIACLGVISFLENEQPALDEMRRILRPGGTLLVSVRSTRALTLWLDPVHLGKVLVGRLMGNRSVGAARERRAKRFDPDALQRRFCAMGFSVRHVEYLGYGPWRFNRREILPARVSIAISSWIDRLFRWGPLTALTKTADVCIIALQKQPSAPLPDTDRDAKEGTG